MVVLRERFSPQPNKHDAQGSFMFLPLVIAFLVLYPSTFAQRILWGKGKVKVHDFHIPGGNFQH